MQKSKKIKIASILGITGNLFLSIIKGIIGFMTNSRAMIADALNSATDILTSLMTFIGNKIASKPGDDDHNLGHGKAEYIYSMLISITMMFMSLTIFKDSISTLINKSIYEYSHWLFNFSPGVFFRGRNSRAGDRAGGRKFPCGSGRPYGKRYDCIY